MVDIVLVVIGSIAGLALGVWAGLKWGMALIDKSSGKYWLANGAMLLAGMVVVVAGQALGAMWFAVAGAGIMAGGITGLKYGYGKSPGVWAIHDRLMGIDGPEGEESDPARR